MEKCCKVFCRYRSWCLNDTQWKATHVTTASLPWVSREGNEEADVRWVEALLQVYVSPMMDVDTSDSDTASAPSSDVRWHRAAPITTGESTHDGCHNVTSRPGQHFNPHRRHLSVSHWTVGHICQYSSGNDNWDYLSHVKCCDHCYNSSQLVDCCSSHQTQHFFTVRHLAWLMSAYMTVDWQCINIIPPCHILFYCSWANFHSDITETTADDQQDVFCYIILLHMSDNDLH